MDGYSIALVIAALITAIPAAVAAKAALRASKNSKTTNGQTQAQVVEEIRSEQVKMALALLQTEQRRAFEAAAIAADREADRQLMQDHIRADLEWQAMVEPHIMGGPQVAS